MRNSRAIRLSMAAMMLVASSIVPQSRAEMVPTELFTQVVPPSVAFDRVALAALLARESTREQMQALGVDPAEATERVAALSDAEIARLGGQLDQQPAGGAAILLLLIVAGLLWYLSQTDSGDPQCSAWGSSC